MSSDDEQEEFSLQPTMEEAIETLQHSLALAQVCHRKPIRLADEYDLHVKALAEDMQALALTKTTTPATIELARKTQKEALWLRRTLEREAVVLRTEATAVKTEKSPPKDKKKIKLQSLAIPNFSGDITKFRMFYDTFVDNIENNDDLTDTAKWIHLEKSTSGQAAELIAKIPRRPETRKIALDMLVNRYGSDDHTIADIYQQLNTMPQSTMNDHQLRMTQSQIEGLLLSLEGLGHEVNTNSYIKSVIKGKFPRELLHLVVPDPTSDNLKQIRTNLQNVLAAREGVINDVVYTSAPSTSRAAYTPGAPKQRSNPTRTVKCIFCGQDHWSDECPVYTTASTRRAKINNRCSKCFRMKHDGDCVTKRRCAHCDSPDHNRALCPIKFPDNTTLYANTPILPPTNEGVYLTLLLKVSSETVQEPIAVRAVIDSGGAQTILSTDIADKLQIQPNSKRNVNMKGLGNTDLPSIIPTRQRLRLHTPKGEPVLLQVSLTPIIADDLPVADQDHFKTTYPQHASVPLAPTGSGQKIDLLIGKDALADVCTLHNSIYVSQQHQLLSTHFGFLILGKQFTITQSSTSHTLLSFESSTKDELTRFWQLDTIGLGEIQNQDEQEEELALQKFHQTINYVNGRYEVGWPLISNPPMINEDYGLAYGRLKSLWNKLQKDKQLLLAYHEIILDQIKQGIIEAVEHTAESSTALRHYLPHHPIIKQEKSTKVRIVYDASAKTQNNSKSLNENLHTGGKWVGHILTILLHFRTHRNVVMADIEKAFLQIQIRPTDRDLVRFLWIKDPLKPPAGNNIWTLRFCRMAFGIVSSPFLLAATILFHLKNNQHEYNEIVRECLYADNLIAALPDAIDPKHFYIEIKEIFRQMGMNMTKWVTNVAELTEQIPIADRDTATYNQVLGLRWDKILDNIQIKPPTFSSLDSNILTKRKALQQMASIFDPLGLAAPIILKAKIFIRKLWAEKVEWDDKMLAEKRIEWQIILSHFHNIHRIKVSRQYFPTISVDEAQEIEMHIFTDTSAEAYAVVIYATAISSSKQETAFIAAKTRLTPTKMKSIPRLELLAILLGTRFAAFVIQSLKWTKKPITYLWSDSKCALAWIHNSKLLPPLILRQVGEINKASIDHIRYVPSDKNYADVASRGATTEELEAMQWWRGPNWLSDKSKWPTETTATDNADHQEPTLLFHTKQTEKIIPETLRGLMNISYNAFSSFSKLLIIVARCIHAINRIFKRTVLPTQSNLDTQYAEQLMIIHEQKQAYKSVYESIKVPLTLRNLRVFADQDQVLRCNTRISASNVPYDAASPILLVRGSRLTSLIILQTHVNNKHSGTSHTLAQLRKRYWIPQGRREVYSVIRRECYHCRKYFAQPYVPPPPSPLPEFRITQTDRPFQFIGVDVLGPFKVRPNTIAENSKSKRWIFLLTCAVTRAIHLETLADMATPSFLEALRRFIARRGSPDLIVCDNAPQLHALDDASRQLWPTIASDSTTVAYFAQQRIQFKFLPPNSPWMGGFYERLVATIKTALEKTYANKTLLARQFDTSVIEIEGIINARPLTYVDAQPGSKIITPQDFLNVKYTAVPLDSTPIDSRNRIVHLWRSSQSHIEEFWRNWHDHFLMYLRERDDKLRTKKTGTQSIPQHGDLVLLVEPDKKRCAWRIGRIETIIKSHDGHIRSALVNLGNNVRLVKPIIKLAPIGLQADVIPTNIPQLNDAKDAIVIDNTPFDATEPTDEEETIEIQLDEDW